MNLEKSVVEQIAMLTGMALYTLFNYIGQRFFLSAKDQKKFKKIRAFCNEKRNELSMRSILFQMKNE